MGLRREFGWSVLLLAAAACAQQQPSATSQGDQPLPTLRLETRVVAVGAVVRDSKGNAVENLRKDDFLLKQDGRPQAIEFFSAGVTLPLRLTLMIDTSGSQQMFLADETAASMVFFRSMLTEPTDEACLLQFDTGIVERQPLTHSVDDLQRALDYLDTPHPALVPGSHGGTLLYDAIVRASRPLPAGQRGRRALVLLTDGGDNGSTATLPQAIAAAQRADIVIYSVFYSGAAAQFPPASPGHDVLDELSSATGGAVFTVGGGQPLRRIFALIAEDLRVQYQIGFHASDAVPGSYHKLDLKTVDHKLKVRARRGYFSPGGPDATGDRR